MGIIDNRYKNDGKSILKLNQIQLENKKNVEDKIESKEYVFENVKCVVCDDCDFELLAEKDRYGLYVPTVICKKCGLLQTNPRMNQESYNKFYDSGYRKLYHGIDVPTDEFFRGQVVRGRTILEFIEQKTQKKFRNKFIVEIGTGAGGILQAFKENDNDVFGLDLGSEYIEFGRLKGLNLNVGTTDQLDKLSAKPDLLIYSHVLEHILNPGEELIKLKKYLKEDSLVYIEVPGVMNLTKTYDQDLLQYLQNAHVYHFSLETLNNLAQKSGLRLIYGNEVINAIFELNSINKIYKNVYVETIEFLKDLEKKRKNPFSIYKIKNHIFNLLYFLSKKTGFLNTAKKIYRFFISV